MRLGKTCVWLDSPGLFVVRPGVPIARPEIWEEEPYQARLRWRRVFIPPYDNLDVPLTYQIEVQEPPLKNWRTLVKGLTMTEHTVTDLTPKKDYLFRIRAEDQNGDLTEPTPPIAYYRSRCKYILIWLYMYINTKKKMKFLNFSWIMSESQNIGLGWYDLILHIL